MSKICWLLIAKYFHINDNKGNAVVILLFWAGQNLAILFSTFVSLKVHLHFAYLVLINPNVFCLGQANVQSNSGTGHRSGKKKKK